MVSQDDDSTGWIIAVILSVVALVTSSVIGMAIYQKNKTAKTLTAQAEATQRKLMMEQYLMMHRYCNHPKFIAQAVAAQDPRAAATQAAASTAADAAAVIVERGVVKFFFASGKSELPEGGPQALADTIASAKAGKIAMVSGYVDSTGNVAQNKKLGKLRAFAVRDLLTASGVPADKIELKKPDAINAGTGAQARRVEVTLQ